MEGGKVEAWWRRSAVQCLAEIPRIVGFSEAEHPLR